MLKMSSFFDFRNPRIFATFAPSFTKNEVSMTGTILSYFSTSAYIDNYAVKENWKSTAWTVFSIS